ncbi:MAG: hypothetical protein ACE5IG_03085 [Dehalococcoidia bacterium]
MSLLRAAIRDQRWEVAALCLLIGAMQAALTVPQDALPGLLEVLEGESGDHPG